MKHFTLKELVHPYIRYILSPELCWRLIPDYARVGLDRLRDLYGGPIWCNTDEHDSRGIRPINDPDGAKHSGHKGYRGLACFDLVCKDPVRLRGLIEAHWQELSIGEVERYEYTPNWTHVAFVYLPKTLRFIKP